MPATQMRVQIPSDFEDITLYGPNEIQDKDWNRHRNPSAADFTNSFSTPIDPHYSVASSSSTVSTPTLASDTSSLRSSLSSQSSPNIAHASPHHLPAMALPHEIKVNESLSSSSAGTSSGYNRNRSVPALIDTTSMASLTIKSQSNPRSRKQREMDFEADNDDDIWPGDTLMFNVPMSPALYAQQKMKHYQMNSVPAVGHRSTNGNNTKQVNTHGYLRTHPDFQAIPPQQGHLNVKKRAHNRTAIHNNTPSHQYTPSPLTQQISKSASTSQVTPKRSSGLRHDISHDDGSISPTRRDSTDESNTVDENKRDDLHAENDERLYSHHDDMSYTKQPGYYSPANVSSFEDSFITSNLSPIFARNGSASGGNSSINGLDADASDLTLELFELQETRHRASHGLPRDCNFADSSVNSISNLAMADDDGESLPSPMIAEDPSSAANSRRSSLTRPENLPPKDPEEEKKHLKEYEKLLKEAAVAEKKKQQKREEEAKKRAQQTKLDLSTWNNWLAKGCKGSLNSDLKWRGLPDKVRPNIWNLKMVSKPDAKTSFSNQLPPFQMRHNFNYIEKEIVEDSEKIWPDCAIFGPGRPFHEPLINVIQQFMSIRKEVPYSFELTGIAAVLLLQLSERDSVRSMLSLLEPGTLVHSILTGNERIASANYVTFTKLFRSKFPHLSEHFAKVDLSVSELMNPLIGGYFTTVLPRPEYATRILDVFIFEGDSFLLRAALGLIRINEAFFYGSKHDILIELKHPRIGSEDSLMNAIRDVTRK